MNPPWTEMCKGKESIWRLCAIWNEEQLFNLCLFDFPQKRPTGRLFDICCSIEENRSNSRSRCGRTLQANSYNGRALPGGSYRHMFPRRGFQRLKSAPQSEDKINDCGNLSHNTANDFQWSINTSMAFFGKKEKVWRPNSDVYGNISIHACAVQWCTGSWLSRFYVIFLKYSK
jgi:hypothetical protein